MKSLLFVALIPTALGCTVLANLSDSDKQKPEPKLALNPTAVAMNQRTSMTDLYNSACAKCHGVNGEGGGGGALTLLTRDRFGMKEDAKQFNVIKLGTEDKSMDPYGQTMDDKTIWGLVVHIRELQAKALRAQEGSPKPQGGVYTSSNVKFKVETVVETGKGLKTPWSISWAQAGEMYVTSRSGQLHVFKNGESLGQVEGIPASVEMGQGGLMEVAVHPTNGWVYLTLADPGGRGASTKVVRGKINRRGTGYKWESEQTIYKSAEESYIRSGVHFGSKIVFDGKGYIFFTHGERGNGNLAQDLSKPNGKIFRLKEDGSIPSDNPFVKNEKALKGIWTLGHRNPQGLAMTPDGILYDTEHAPRGGDELNQIVKGVNYGWPVVSYGINYNDSAYAVPWGTIEQGFRLPIHRWLPSIGASGLTAVIGKGFPAWKGNLIAGGLSGANVDRFEIVNGQLVKQEELLHGMGRVREVREGPDGNIYIALNGPDKIIRMVPAK